MNLQAMIWCRQDRLGEARSEALCATDVYEKLGATTDLEFCRALLRDIEEEMENPAPSDGSDSNGELDSDGELPEIVRIPARVGSSQGTE